MNKLLRDEKIKGVAVINNKSIIPHVFMILIIIGIFTTIYQLTRIYKTKIQITNIRFIASFGMFKSNYLTIPLNNIDHVITIRDFLGKILNYGTVIVSTNGSNYTFKHIKDCYQLQHIIYTQIENRLSDRIDKQAKAVVDRFYE